MQLRTRRLLATTAALAVATAGAACSAEVDEDGANIEVEDGDDGGGY